MITTYLIDLPESNYLYIAKKYGWSASDDNDNSYIEFTQNWFMKNIIVKEIAKELTESENIKLTNLITAIESDAVLKAEQAVTLI